MKLLSLTNTTIKIMLDDIDYFNASRFKWCIKYSQTGLRVESTAWLSKGKAVNITNFIMDKYGVIFDHIDFNQLNDQRNNLREATYSQNNIHTHKIEKARDCSSTYKGVSWNKARKKWKVAIRPNKKIRLHLGYFVDEIEAAKVYDEAANRHHGEFAVLNFPLEVKKTS
jgi:hypothetical protein